MILEPAAIPAPPEGKTGWPWTEGDPSASPAGSPSGATPGTPDGELPKISIVVPSFNQGSYLEETLRSILLQAYPGLELIVLDGGSRDRSVEILERYDPWITFWRSEPDGGQSDAINKGFARATGDLVTFFGSDDVYLPGTFLDAARTWKQNPGSGAVVGAFQFMDDRSRPVAAPVPPRLAEPAPLDLAVTDPAAWRMHQVSTFYSREALDAVGRRVKGELRYTMDRELLFRVCRRFPAAFSDRLYARFRRHATSKSVSEVLPFCEEMAQLHLMDADPSEAPEIQRRRQRYVRHWLAKGQLKSARVAAGPLAAAKALLKALSHQPALLLKSSYLRFWIKAFLPRPALAREKG